jgi:hypothetical protein
MLGGSRGRLKGRVCSRQQWILGTSPRMTAVKASLDDRPSSYGRNLQLLVADSHNVADRLAHQPRGHGRNE